MLIDVREGGKEGGKEGETTMWERNIDWLSLIGAPTEDRIRNLSMYPHQESNPWPFGLWHDTQSTEPHWLGLKHVLFNKHK